MHLANQKTSQSKYQLSLRVLRNELLCGTYHLIDVVIPSGIDLNIIKPGQFVEVAAPNERYLLRRPISICDILREERLMRLLIAPVGRGTEQICKASEGENLDIVFPLGNGFSLPDKHSKPLLIGGGVGIAPLLYQAKEIFRLGITPTVLLGAKEGRFLKLGEVFEPYCNLVICTDDGSLGHKGFVTEAPIWDEFDYTHTYVCGPMPMMKNLAKLLVEKKVVAEFSLENMMACGLGACLCCVEDTKDGHKCVCTEGPVFNLKDLKWLENK